MKSLPPALIFILCYVVALFFGEPAEAQDYYGAYGYYSMGSSRVLGLAGAYTSNSEDGNSLFHNPAGPALGKWKYTVEGATNKLNNSELQNSTLNFTTTIPSEFQFFFAGVRLGNFAFGAGSSSPYSISLEEFDQSSSVSVTNSSLLAAYRLTDKFGVGVAIHQSHGKETFHDTTGSFKTSADQRFYSVGLRYGSSRYGLGFSYQPKVIYTINSHDVAWFKDLVAPEKSSIGFHTSIGDRTTLYGGYDIIGQVDHATAVESPYLGMGNPLTEENMNIFRGGLEIRLSDKEDSGATWRVGAYREPSRFAMQAARIHYTMGFELQFGPAVLQVATDTGTKFSNSSQSLSLEFNKL